MEPLAGWQCARELLPSAVSGVVGIILLWGTYRRSSTLIEPHIHSPLDLRRPLPQDWLRRTIPKTVMVGLLYVLGLAFVAGAGLGVHDAVAAGSCGRPAS